MTDLTPFFNQLLESHRTSRNSSLKESGQQQPQTHVHAVDEFLKEANRIVSSLPLQSPSSTDNIPRTPTSPLSSHTSNPSGNPIFLPPPLRLHPADTHAHTNHPRPPCCPPQTPRPTSPTQTATKSTPPPPPSSATYPRRSRTSRPQRRYGRKLRRGSCARNSVPRVRLMRGYSDGLRGDWTGGKGL